VNEVRTVSDTKRAFYNAHTRPINSIYRRIVEELMVEMHLLSVNTDFRYDPIYALGVVTTFDRFMQGYRPETDKTSIFNALCQAVGGNADPYRQQAEQIRSEVASLSVENFQSNLQNLGSFHGDGLFPQLRGIAENPNFKYNRLFAVGLFTLLEQMNPAIAKDAQQRDSFLESVAQPLKLPTDKLQKDLELYRSNLDKFAQAQVVLEDILKADRKKKEERAKQKDAVSSSASSSEP
jgi:photosystem II biogenesis protein Psp29